MADNDAAKPKKAVNLPSDPVQLCPAAYARALAGDAAFPLLPELAAHEDMRPFRPYLASLPEEDQIAVAMRLAQPHMCDIYMLDRTVGYKHWALAHPAEHAAVQAAKPQVQRIRLPPRLDELLAGLPWTPDAADET